MGVSKFAQWLVPVGWLVLAGGWVLAVVAFLAIGTETCTTVNDVPLVGPLEACTDTTASAVILFVVVGFSATLGSTFLWTLRYALNVLEQIEANTRPSRK